jgi:hypothetical protein
MLQIPKFESDTAIANIPGTVDVLEESVTKKRDHSITSAAHMRTIAGHVPIEGVSVAFAPAIHVLVTLGAATPRLMKQAGLILMISSTVCWKAMGQRLSWKSQRGSAYNGTRNINGVGV